MSNYDYTNVLFYLNESTESINESLIDTLKKLYSRILFKIKYTKRFRELIKAISRFTKTNPNVSKAEADKFAAKQIETFVGYFSFDSLYNLATIVKNSSDEDIEHLKTDEVLMRLTSLVTQSIKRLNDEDTQANEAYIITRVLEFASIPWNYSKDKFGTAIDWANEGFTITEDDCEEE
jgi:Fic family protein